MSTVSEGTERDGEDGSHRPSTVLYAGRAKPGPFTALTHRNFALFLGARVLAGLAVQMQGVAIGWQVYAITGKALDLGLIGLAQFLPFVVLVLPAGQVADHFNRRTIVATATEYPT